MGLASTDAGRAEGIDEVRSDGFNCMGPYSDAGKGDCAELRFMDTDKSKYMNAFKTPSLRNVTQRPPYMHAGQLGTIREVLEHYNSVASGKAKETSLIHGQLSKDEIHELEEFLKTLDGDVISP